MKRYKLGLVIVLFFGIFILIETGRHPLKSASIPQRPIQVALVKAIYFHDHVSAIGILKAEKGLQVSNSVLGVVHAIYFQSGQNVKKGDILLELENTDLKAKLKEDLEKYHFASRQFLRYHALFKTGAIAKVDVEKLQSLMRQFKAAAVLDQALLEKTIIVAPFSGTLGINRISVGQFLPAGSPIVSLYDLNDIDIDFSIPEKWASWIEGSESVDIFQYPRGPHFVGQIFSKEVRIDSETLSLSLRAKIPGNFQSRHLLPGMLMKVELQSARVHCAFFIPERALNYSAQGEFVYVYQNNRVKRQAVISGKRKGNLIQIITGLNSSDPVVVAGQAKLFDGASVSVVQ